MLTCTRLFILSFSNIFFSAYSDAKLLLFLVTLSLFFLINISFGKVIARQKINLTKNILSIYILTSILLLFGVLTYLYACHKFGLPWQNVAIIVDHEIFSTFTGIFHNHTIKPIVTWLLIPLGMQDLKVYGTALPFFTMMPELRWIYIGMSLLLGILIIFMGRIGIVLAQKNKNFWFSLTYVIFAYGLLKGTVDGGILWFEVYVYLFFYSLLLWWSKKGFPSFNWKTVLAMVLGAFTWAKTIHVFTYAFIFSFPVISLMRSIQYAMFSTIFAGLACLFMTMNAKKGILIALLCMCFAIYLQRFASPIARTFNSTCTIESQKCQKDTRIPKKRTLHILEGNLGIIHADMKQNIQGLQVIEKQNNTYTILYFIHPCPEEDNEKLLIEYLYSLGLRRYILI